MWTSKKYNFSCVLNLLVVRLRSPKWIEHKNIVVMYWDYKYTLVPSAYINVHIIRTHLRRTWLRKEKNRWNSILMKHCGGVLCNFWNVVCLRICVLIQWLMIVGSSWSQYHKSDPLNLHPIKTKAEVIRGTTYIET